MYKTIARESTPLGNRQQSTPPPAWHPAGIDTFYPGMKKNKITAPDCTPLGTRRQSTRRNQLGNRQPSAATSICCGEK